MRGVLRNPAANLGDPPPQADEQESPVVEELRRLAFECVPDELEDPTHHEQCERYGPEAGREHGNEEQRQRDDDQRDPERVTQAIDRMPMTLRVACNPIVPGPSGQHHASVRGGSGARLFSHDTSAHIGAFVAGGRVSAGEQLPDHVLRLAAEGTTKHLRRNMARSHRLALTVVRRAFGPYQMNAPMEITIATAAIDWPSGSSRRSRINPVA